jgi:molecular chaperone GrpE
MTSKEKNKEEKEMNKKESQDSEKIEIERKDSKKSEKESKKDKSSKELEEAKKKIEELEKKVSELNDSYLRKVAEFENYKRRTENDQLNLVKYAAENFILNILPIFDDLGRSLKHIKEEDSFESTKKGLEMVYDKFGKVLESQGVKRMEVKGKEFDFNFHEALMQQKVEGVPPHTVIEEVEPGYMYKDKVIRHAKVIVSQESSDDTPKDTGDSKENDSNNE